MCVCVYVKNSAFKKKSTAYKEALPKAGPSGHTSKLAFEWQAVTSAWYLGNRPDMALAECLKILQATHIIVGMGLQSQPLSPLPS